MAKAVLEGGISPLEVMLQTMRAKWDDKDKEGACAIAKDAAPYLHPRLATVQAEHKGSLTIVVETGVPRDD